MVRCLTGGASIQRKWWDKPNKTKKITTENCQQWKPNHKMFSTADPIWQQAKHMYERFESQPRSTQKMLPLRVGPAHTQTIWQLFKSISSYCLFSAFSFCLCCVGSVQFLCSPRRAWCKSMAGPRLIEKQKKTIQLLCPSFCSCHFFLCLLMCICDG